MLFDKRKKEKHQISLRIFVFSANYISSSYIYIHVLEFKENHWQSQNHTYFRLLLYLKDICFLVLHGIFLHQREWNIVRIVCKL